MGSAIAFAVVAFGVVLAFAGAELCARALRAVGRGPLAGLGALAGALAASAPELLFAARAQWDGLPDLALGLAAGSLIANALLAVPLAAAGATERTDGVTIGLGLWTALGAAVLIWAAWDGIVAPLEGAVMLVGAAVAAALTAFGTPRGETDRPRQPLWMSAAGLLAGAVLLVFGAIVAVDAAALPAGALLGGALVTGLVVFGLAAALPEIAAAGFAARRGAGRSAMSAVVAGTAITAFGTVGAAAVTGPMLVEDGFMRAPAAAMAAASVLIALIVLAGGRLPRWAPAVGAVVYLAVIGLFLHAASGA